MTNRFFLAGCRMAFAVVALALPASGIAHAWSGSGQPVRFEVAQATPPDPALAEKVRRSNDQCLSCHSAAGVANPPRADLDLERLKTFLVDPTTFKDSNHGGVECKTCHGQAYVPYPHRPNARAQISPCEECHAQKVLRLEPQFIRSVHARNLPGRFTCATCHDPHRFQVARKIGNPRRIVSQDNAMCLDCHADDRRFRKTAKPDTPRPDLDHIHDWLPNPQRHWQSVRCVECHTPVSTVDSLSLSHEILDKTRAVKDCVACHSADTALRTRLYRHLVDQEQQTAGFMNSVILRDAYVVGAMRNTYLDTGMTVLLGLTVAALGGHGLIRILAALWRRTRRHG
ncbi:MAG TPA: cytochrome c3 family protein [Ramlibacter sp.]